MSETDKLKVEMYDDVVKEKNKEYIELTCRFRETCNDIKNKDKEIEYLSNKLEIANNKLNMIKDNAQILTPDELLEIIENYTGFFGKESDKNE